MPEDHGDIQVRAAAEGHVWVHDSTAAGVYDDVCGLCYHRRSLEPCCSEPVPLFIGSGIAGHAARQLVLPLTGEPTLHPSSQT